MYTVLIKDKFYLYFFLCHFIHEIHNASYNIYYVTYDMWFLMTVMFNLMANTPSSSCAGDTVLTHPTIILPFPWFLDITLHQFSLLPLWPLAFTLFSWSFFFFLFFISKYCSVPELGFPSSLISLLWCHWWPHVVYKPAIPCSGYLCCSNKIKFSVLEYLFIWAQALQTLHWKLSAWPFLHILPPTTISRTVT